MMNEPATWDSGGRWDSGLTWNGLVPQSQKTKRMSNTKVIVDFTDLRLKHAGIPGTIIARWKPPRRSSTNEVQTCTGDPNEEASWTQYGIFQGGKAVLRGLTPGAIIWVRVRTVVHAGVMGTWSDPAQIRVL